MRRLIPVLLILVACNEPDPQIQTQIDGLKQSVTRVEVSVDSIETETNSRLSWFQEEMDTLAADIGTLAVQQESMFDRTEQLEIANARQDAELVRISREFASWTIDSQRAVRQLLLDHSAAIARLEALIDSLKGPIGTPDSLGNVCYQVEPDQTFRYFLYHNFRDTLGNYEEGIKYHTAFEAYRTVADLYAGRQYDKSSLDYQWHDYNYARFKDVAILTKDGLKLRLPVNIILPYRNMYYVIAHAVIDKAGNESTWNRSIDEGYYVRVK